MMISDSGLLFWTTLYLYTYAIVPYPVNNDNGHSFNTSSPKKTKQETISFNQQRTSP